jgi:hypothetical protein
VSDLRFVWDRRKAAANLRKHGVSFEEARTVFFDDQALVAPDPDHSNREDRFLIVGFSIRARLLLVCFCEREQGDLIRIIMARKATRREQGQFAAGGIP